MLRDLAHHEALAIIVGDGCEVQAVFGFARHAPCRIAGQDIDLAIPQFLEALVGVERNEFDLVRVVEDRSRNRAADIDIEARPVALVVRHREAGQPGVHTAQHRITAHRSLQGPRVVAFIGDGRRSDAEGD